MSKNKEYPFSYGVAHTPRSFRHAVDAVCNNSKSDLARISRLLAMVPAPSDMKTLRDNREEFGEYFISRLTETDLSTIPADARVRDAIGRVQNLLAQYECATDEAANALRMQQEMKEKAATRQGFLGRFVRKPKAEARPPEEEPRIYSFNDPKYASLRKPGQGPER